MQTTTATVH